jgi:hypothetical protein
MLCEILNPLELRKEREMKTAITKSDLAELSSDNPRVKYGRAKSLVAVAKKRPELLYPHLGFFIKLLKTDNNILKWNSIDIIGLLSKVDDKQQIVKLLNELYRFLASGRLITANHAISALANVALAKPERRKRITQELLNIEHYVYETEECHNIALGKVVQALGLYSTDKSPAAHVVEFVNRQSNNPRPATRKKAEKFLQGLGKSTKRGA